MRQMSFALTTQQILDRTKTVTRRVGWLTLQPGTRIQAVEKSQGLRKGERVKRLAVLRITDVRREPLQAITADDVVAEGFPGMSVEEFISMFCRSHRVPVAEFRTFGGVVSRTDWVRPEDNVTRIAFEYEEVR
jgi:hypothetical protein